MLKYRIISKNVMRNKSKHCVHKMNILNMKVKTNGKNTSKGPSVGNNILISMMANLGFQLDISVKMDP